MIAKHGSVAQRMEGVANHTAEDRQLRRSAAEDRLFTAISKDAVANSNNEMKPERRPQTVSYARLLYRLL